jgi:hypothetical protein
MNLLHRKCRLPFVFVLMGLWMITGAATGQMREGLSQVTSVPGTILDVKEGRILYKSPNTPPDTTDQNAPIPNTLYIRMIASGQDTLIKSLGTRTGTGILTPRGAVFSVGSIIHKFRDGQVLVLGGTSSPSPDRPFRVRGNFAAYPFNSGFVLRDLSAGTSTRVTIEETVDDTFHDVVEVGLNGDVLFTLRRSNFIRLLRWRSGTITAFPGTGAFDRYGIHAVTDGESVLYSYVAGCFAGPCKRVGKVLIGPDGQHQELFFVRGEDPRFPGEMNNGHIAYDMLDGLGRSRVWIRSASLTQAISPADASMFLNALNPLGEALIRGEGGFYLAKAGRAAPLRIGSGSLGKGVWMDGLWYIYEGDSLFVVKGTLPRRLADVNGDDSVDVADAVMTLQAAVHAVDLFPNERFAADVNSDDAVDVNDVAKILRVIVGLDLRFSG